MAASEAWPQLRSRLPACEAWALHSLLVCLHAEPVLTCSLFALPPNTTPQCATQTHTSAAQACTYDCSPARARTRPTLLASVHSLHSARPLHSLKRNTTSLMHTYINSQTYSSAATQPYSTSTHPHSHRHTLTQQHTPPIHTRHHYSTGSHTQPPQLPSSACEAVANAHHCVRAIRDTRAAATAHKASQQTAAPDPHQLADHATVCLQHAAANTLEHSLASSDSCCAGASCALSPSSLVGLAQEMAQAGLSQLAAWQALGDLLLPHALSTAQPHTHSSPTPLNHSLFDSSSVSHQSQCRMTSTAGASSLAAATTAKTTAHTNTSETPLSGCVRPAAVVGPQLLSPAEIATVAFCFGGGGGTETRSEQLGVGRQMQGVDSSSCESGIPFSSGAASTAVNSGHRSDQLLNQPYHHVPLFRALAAAALAPAVHSGSSLPFITTSYHTPSPPALSAVGNGESSLPDLVYHRDASGRTALECMGLHNMSHLLSGFTSVSHYDHVLWNAAVGDASTWLGAHTHSTLSMLAQAVRRATTGVSSSPHPHHHLSAPSHHTSPLQHTPSHNTTTITPTSSFASSPPSSHPFPLPDLARLAEGLVGSGHVEAAPSTASPLLSAIAREAARQTMAALPTSTPTSGKDSSSRNIDSSSRNIDSSSTDASQSCAGLASLSGELHSSSHSLVCLLSVLSSVGVAGPLLLDSAATLLLPHLHTLSPQAQLSLLRVYAPLHLSISSGSTSPSPSPSSHPHPPTPIHTHPSALGHSPPSLNYHQNSSSGSVGAQGLSFSSRVAAQRQQVLQQQAQQHAQQVAGVGQRQELLAALAGGPLADTAANISCALRPKELVEAAGRMSAVTMAVPPPPSWPWPHSTHSPQPAHTATSHIKQWSTATDLHEGDQTATDLHVGCHVFLGAAGDVLTQMLQKKGGLERVKPSCSSTVATACELTVAMARVAHHHAPLLAALTHSLTRMHTPLPSSNLSLQAAPSLSPSLSLLPLLGPASLTHTAAAFARIGAEQAPQVCQMALQALGLLSISPLEPVTFSSSPDLHSQSSTPNNSSSHSPLSSTAFDERSASQMHERDRNKRDKKQPGGLLASLLGVPDADTDGSGRQSSKSAGSSTQSSSASLESLISEDEDQQAADAASLSALLSFPALAELTWAVLLTGPQKHTQDTQQHAKQQQPPSAHSTQQHQHSKAHQEELLRAALRLYRAAAHAYRQQGNIQVFDPHVLLLAQAHIILMAELGSSFTDAIARVPSLTSWANTLQYAWEAQARSELRGRQQHLTQELRKQKEWLESITRRADEEAQRVGGRAAAGGPEVRVMQEGVGEREDELAHSAAFGDGVGRRNAWEDKSTAARVFASSSRSRSSTPSSWADSLASQPPLSSVLLQHEVTEALRSPVMPKPHQHRHVNTQERQQGKGGLSLTDLHTPLAPGASSMVLNLEGFEVVVDVALLDAPGLRVSSDLLEQAERSTTDRRVTALLCHGPERFCYVHAQQPEQHHTTNNSASSSIRGSCLKGSALWTERVLRRLGWRVLHVSYWEWPPYAAFHRTQSADVYVLPTATRPEVLRLSSTAYLRQQLFGGGDHKQ